MMKVFALSAISFASALTVENIAEGFDYEAHASLLQLVSSVGVKNFLKSKAYNNYRNANQAHCDGANAEDIDSSLSNMAGQFPGGSVNAEGWNLAKLVNELASKANGPAGASGSMVETIGMQATETGLGLIQMILADITNILPPLIPPPVWNNQPLYCLPMVTGHNCFGAVLYPITTSDFVMAQTTDSMLDGVIAGFPNTYLQKVGKTDDDMYKLCFASYMSMMCSSIFPRCASNPQSTDVMGAANGRVPMCFTNCISTLVLCPGMWNEVLDTCSQPGAVSVPPLCSQATFWNVGLLPPQYASFDDENSYPLECPAETSSKDLFSNGGASGSTTRMPLA